MERVNYYIQGWNQRHKENFFLELLSHGKDFYLVIRCRPGVRCDIGATSWELLRAKVFCGTNQVLQVTPDPNNQNFEEFTAKENGKLTLLFRKDINEFDSAEAGKFILKLEKLLTQTLPEYVYAA
ncbi:hypothetical protein IJI91_00770 [Candidatus Saccharibacteria bacterium]|nr:hypothetical protein [Candidatus Saccharibacteria bacterium]